MRAVLLVQAALLDLRARQGDRAAAAGRRFPVPERDLGVVAAVFLNDRVAEVRHRSNFEGFEGLEGRKEGLKCYHILIIKNMNSIFFEP